MRVIRQILSKPRSRRFQYRLNNNQPINIGGGSTIINDSRPESQEIGVFDTYSSIPNPPDPQMLKLQIVRDTNTIYNYDTTTNQWVTSLNGVDKIVQGNNITITSSPVANSGKGVVTINSTGGLNFVGGSGDVVRFLSYNSSTNTLTETRANLFDLLPVSAALDNIAYPNSQVPFMTGMSGNYNNPGVKLNTLYKMLMPGTNVTFTQSGSNLYINSTGGGSGGVTSVSETQSYTNQTNGIYFREASGTPAIVGGNLNLPYQRLMPGTGITFTQQNANITINATGGGSGAGNVVSNLPSNQTYISMYRYEVYLSSPITMNPYTTYISQAISPSNCGMSMIYNIFPSFTWIGSAPGGYQACISLNVLRYSNSASASFNYVINNSGPNAVTIPSGTEINCLVFGY